MQSAQLNNTESDASLGIRKIVDCKLDQVKWKKLILSSVVVIHIQEEVNGFL